jgi:hypothetical protein
MRTVAILKSYPIKLQGLNKRIWEGTFSMARRRIANPVDTIASTRIEVYFSNNYYLNFISS